MKKFAFAAFVLAVFCCYQTHARVTFLPRSDESVGAAPSNESCIDNGYTHTTCSGALVNPCPDDPHYFKTCCPAGYKYTLQQCGANISMDNCHGYYKCTPNQTADNHCSTEGFTSKIPVATCDPNGPCVSYTMPGCPVGKTLKTCSDATGSYWKCE